LEARQRGARTESDLAAPAPRLVAALEVELVRRRVLHPGRRARGVVTGPLGIARARDRTVPRALVELPRAPVRAARADRAVVAVALDLERARLEAREVAVAPRAPMSTGGRARRRADGGPPPRCGLRCVPSGQRASLVRLDDRPD